MANATFAAGCFWGVEELFRQQPGILSTQVGYSGGYTINPTYEQVCTDTTGHAEAINIEYDPQQISYQKLLQIFFQNHNPTTLNYQGSDRGSQYRSVIFYHNDEQKSLALDYIQQLEKSKHFKQPIVTTVIAFNTFYRAEEYHQQYIKKRKGW